METNIIKECKIDNNGEFKYVQILCTNKEDKNKTKLIPYDQMDVKPEQD